MQVIIQVGVFVVIIVVMYILPIILGIKAAKKANLSPYWVWLGLVLPLGGWIIYLILRNYKSSGIIVNGCMVDYKKGIIVCPSCNKRQKLNLSYCNQCGKEIFSPACPKCHEHKLVYDSKNKDNKDKSLGVAIILFFLGGSAVYTSEELPPGSLGVSILVIFGSVLLVTSAVLFIVAYSNKRRYMKCVGCQSRFHYTDIEQYYIKETSRQNSIEN